MTDFNPDPNLHRVARIACELADRIRDDDPRRLFDELVNLCHRHPAKASQVIMALLAWFDTDATTTQLGDRAEAISRAVA